MTDTAASVSPRPGSARPGSTPSDAHTSAIGTDPLTPDSLAPDLLEPDPLALDPLTLPLAGTRLIEASAGTGKTWTIAALYLRLVLGHGRAAPLAPSQILVMTFTQAATRELVERIRARLVQAAERMRSDTPPGGAADAFLESLVQAYPDAPARELAAWRLSCAAQAMDDAAIFTIDAWCQRMLREHAFDSGCLFDEELEPDESALRRLAVHDHWRQQVYPLQGAALETLLGIWKDVDALEASVRPLLQLPMPEEACAAPMQSLLAEALAQLEQSRQRCRPLIEPLRDWLHEQCTRPDKPFHGNKLKWVHCADWMEDLKRWAEGEEPTPPKLSDAAWRRLSPQGMAEALRKDKTVELHPALATIAELNRTRGGFAPLSSQLRLHASASIRRRLQALKAQRGRFGFADLLDRLSEALDPRRDAPGAQRLRQRILAQYPVALVDEFQDTSPTQLAIFERLHGLDGPDDGAGSQPPGRALLLIGDPKQAIYAFRGADIRSYLHARRATAGRHHRLHTNHRSSEALVAAVNHLFAAAEQRPRGAFLHTTADGRSELPFMPVLARGRRERLVEAGRDADPVHLVLDTELASQGDSARRLAALAAERIVTLLSDSRIGMQAGDEPLEALQHSDIAVLVRQRSEAQAMQQALSQRGVASVYLSDRESVFASDEALDLLRLLSAIAAPRDLRLARAASATALMGLDLARLVQLADNESAFDAFCDALAELLPLWQGQGVLAMLRQMLHRFGLAARWLAQAELDEGGERRLTNVLHLAELLQAASARLEGETALIGWLATRIDEANANPGSAGSEDATLLRLESDAQRVQVVTVHKSKGLEYPIVFLPFACALKPVKPGPGTFWREPSPGQGLGPGLVLEPDAEQCAALDEERLREDLRLLYVALTRARHQLWVGAAALTVGNASACRWKDSALGRLLTGEMPLEAPDIAGELRARLAALPDAGSGIRLECVDAQRAAGRERLVPREAPAPLAGALVYTGRFERRWAIGSYTALVKDTASQRSLSRRPSVPAAVMQRPPRQDEPEAQAEEEAQRAIGQAAHEDCAAAPAPWHHFPRGAFAGNFLHGELEWLATEGFALTAGSTLAATLARRCDRKGWGQRSDALCQWLSAVCAAPLPSLGVPLSGLNAHWAEMEFWLPVHRLDAAAVDALCRRHLMPGRARPALPERSLTGLMMGFADLVFEHEGRFGVLDYKSNALGPDDASYTPAAMEAAMLDNRYDVQAALYGLALHRLLRLRLGTAYDPERHLHGAIYSFLRGVAAPGAGAFHLRLPRALLDALDSLLQAGGAAGTQAGEAPVDAPSQACGPESGAEGPGPSPAE